MEHIRDVDSQTHTILLIQVENEIAVFGADRQDRKLWRDHSSVADSLFAETGEKFSETKDVGGSRVIVSGEDNGQAIVIHPAPNEFILVGYRCDVSLTADMFQWPNVRKVRVERGRYVGRDWKNEGDPLSFYSINTEARSLNVPLMIPQAVRVYW